MLRFFLCLFQHLLILSFVRRGFVTPELPLLPTPDAVPIVIQRSFGMFQPLARIVGDFLKYFWFYTFQKPAKRFQAKKTDVRQIFELLEVVHLAVVRNLIRVFSICPNNLKDLSVLCPR